MILLVTGCNFTRIKDEGKKQCTINETTTLYLVTGITSQASETGWTLLSLNKVHNAT